MRNIKKQVNYSSISFPEEFIGEIKKYVINNPNYKSIADFAREAIREKLQRDNPKMHLANVTYNTEEDDKQISRDQELKKLAKLLGKEVISSLQKFEKQKKGKSERSNKHN